MVEEELLKHERICIFSKSNLNPHVAIVYIHGGAWIDKRNTPLDFEYLGSLIGKNCNDISQYSIDYRLSPEIKHPIHLQDVIKNLNKLIKQELIDEVQILGHSVGATLCWQVMTCESYIVDQEILDFVRSKITKLYMVDGIFSLIELLDEYPEYNYFVSVAYERIEDYIDPKHNVKQIPKHLEIHIIHSFQDELLSLRQSNYLIGVLNDAQIPHYVYIDSLGEHNSVYSNPKLAKYISLRK